MPPKSHHKYPPSTWKVARARWEVDGWSMPQIAKEIGCSRETVANHKKREGWDEKGSRNPALKDGPREPIIAKDPSLDPPEHLQPPTSPPPPALLAENEALKKRLAELEAETQKLRPHTDLAIYTTDNVVEVMGRETFEKGVGDAVKQYHRDRMKDGLPPLDRNDPEMLVMMEEIRGRLKMEAIQQLTQWASQGGAVEVRTRTLKWVKPGKGEPSARLRQTIFEPHINSADGEYRTHVEFYRRKGWQLVNPPRCQLIDCWAGVPLNDQGEFEFTDRLGYAYCSAGHVGIFEPASDRVSVPGAMLAVAGRP